MAAHQIALTSSIECAEIAAAEARSLLGIATLKAPTMMLPEGTQRAPISVSAVIDRSGSMSGTKLTLTQAALRFVVQNLRADDEFGIVSYASEVKESLKLQPMDAHGKRAALDAVAALSSNGGTNLSGGLFAGIDQLKGIPIAVGPPQRERHQGPPNFLGHAAAMVSNIIGMVSSTNGTPLAVQTATGPAPDALRLIVGNECNVADAAAPWTAFVRLADGQAGAIGDHVESVEFEIHEAAGASQRVTVPQAPFELARRGPAAGVTAHLLLTPAHGAAILAVQHTPNFASSMTYCTVPIPSATGPSAPQIITTPPSHPAAAAAAALRGAHNGVIAVWLFTDGLANEGVKDAATLVRLTGERLQGMEPACGVFTFGFGTDHDARLLRDVADAGKGMYYFLETEAAIPEAFADCLGGLTSVVARNLTLTLTPIPGVSILRCHTKFAHAITTTQATVTLPDLYSEEERDVLFDIAVPAVDPANPTPAPLLEIRLQYLNVLTDAVVGAAVTVLLARPAEARPGPVPPRLDQQRNRLCCTEALAAARRQADGGQLGEARQTVTEAIATITGSATTADEFCVGLVEDLRGCLQEMASERQYTNHGNMVMNSMESCHTYQRSAGGNQRYTNSSKSAMVQNWQAK
jgi:hypothetical protein